MSQLSELLVARTAAGGREHTRSELRSVGGSLDTASLTGSCIRRVVFPEKEGTRMRKIVTGARARVTGHFPSWKLQRMLQYESLSERNVFIHLEVDHTVLKFYEQPCRVYYVDDGLERMHTPDALVFFTDRKELWEIKSRQEAIAADVKRRTALMADLRFHGYEYKLVIANDFAIEPTLGNYAKLLQFGRSSVSDIDRETFRRYYDRHSSLTWSDAVQGIPCARARENVCRLVLEGVLTFDATHPWHLSTTFFRNEVLP